MAPGNLVRIRQGDHPVHDEGIGAPGVLAKLISVVEIGGVALRFDRHLDVVGKGHDIRFDLVFV